METGRCKSRFLRCAAAAVDFWDPNGERARAAEIKVLASSGVRAVIAELAPQFEAAKAGHKVASGFDVIAVLEAPDRWPARPSTSRSWAPRRSTI